MNENVNIPLLRKAVEWVEEQDKLPEIDREWRQASYVLKSQYHAQSLVQELYAKPLAVPVSYQEFRAGMERLTQQVAAHCGTAYCVAGYLAQQTDDRFKLASSYYDPKTDTDVHVADVAQELLGLDEESAQLLFEGGNTAADIRRLAEQFAGEKL